MPLNLTDRVKSAWNAFTSRDPTDTPSVYYGSSYRPDRRTNYVSNDASIIEMIKNRIAVDVAQIDLRHVKKDKDNNYKSDMPSQLNQVLSVSANTDQTGRAFIQDLVQSMFDEGCIAAVPVETDSDPVKGTYDIYSVRVGQIVDWYPKHVRVKVFNEMTQKKQEIVVPKATTAIIENPFYTIMNAPNSTLQRLTRTLRNLDVLNEQNASGKMDLIIQLPYSLKSPLKQQQAEGRRKQIEMQLVGSKYGIAYIDAAERITQLNRPVENNLWKEAQDLTAMLFNQLGLTQAIFDGTADEKTMTNYYNRTVEPILAAIAEEMERKWLTQTARTQHQAILYIRDPFKLVSVNDIAEIADKFTRNEIMTSNEIRGKVGLKPVDSERANELVNKNISMKSMGNEPQNLSSEIQNDQETDTEIEPSNTSTDIDSINKQLDDLLASLEGD